MANSEENEKNNQKGLHKYDTNSPRRRHRHKCFNITCPCKVMPM